MALSEDLPLYRDSLRLLNRIIPLTQGFPISSGNVIYNRMPFIALRGELSLEGGVLFS